MLSPKRRNPFAKSSASITNAPIIKPLIQERRSNKLFIPTFDSRSAILFWLSMVGFFACYGLCTKAVIIHSWDMLAMTLFDLLVTNALIVGIIVGYVYINSPKLAPLSSKQLFGHTMLATLIITPIATLLAELLLHVLVDYPLTLSRFLLYSSLNTLMAFAAVTVLFYYFLMQYQQISRYQQHFQRQLLEQNEQLKARITPHFFFNMLNTLQYLIETDPVAAEEMVRNISNLYRVSFDETKEIALLDEIELCQYYLQIEQYRFGSKLSVVWQLPDEDLLYDMVISALSLQLVIEKMIVFVVEMTTERIELCIDISWHHDWVEIIVTVNVPIDIEGFICHSLSQKLSFANQTAMLQHYYGNTAQIHCDYQQQQLKTTIGYVLKDVAD